MDSGEGERLERFGRYVLVRPDPQVIWKRSLPPGEWDRANAIFDGVWKTRDMPRNWEVEVLGLKIELRLTPFKHTGVFPEQESQWVWLQERAKGLNVLNLFGYTGIASLICAAAGARVTHVDASRPTISWARHNQQLSGLLDKPIRWMVEDATKFVEREARRGNKYDGIIMDPPVFGHGPTGKAWQFNKSLPPLLDGCKRVLADKPKFVLINAYAVSTSHVTIANVLADLTMGLGGMVTSGELLINQENSPRVLSTGIWGKWEAS